MHLNKLFVFLLCLGVGSIASASGECSDLFLVKSAGEAPAQAAFTDISNRLAAARGDHWGVLSSVIGQRTTRLTTERDQLIQQFNSTAQPLMPATLQALRDQESRRNEGGYSVRTQRDEQLQTTAAQALAIDPVTSRWSTAERSLLFWFVAVSGRSSLDLDTAVLVARNRVNDPSLRPTEKEALARIVELTVQIKAWNEASNSAPFNGFMGGSLESMAAQEKALFDRAVAGNIFPRPTDQQLNEALQTTEHFRGFWHTTIPIVQARPLLNYVMFKLAQTERAFRRGEVSQQTVNNISDVFNGMYDVSKQIMIIETLASSSPGALLNAWTQEAASNISWGGFGNIY